MPGSDTLTITNSGLFNINKKIISSRTYAGNLITAVGEPQVTNGIASEFSKDDYFIYSPLNFENSEKITINFRGTFFKNTKKQYAFELLSSDRGPLTLAFEDASITLTYDIYTIFSFNNLNLEDDTEIVLFLTLTDTNYELTMNYGSQVLQKSGLLGFPSTVSTFIALNLGSSSLDRNLAWNGNINLNEFSIYKNNSLLYAPSEGTSWNFSNIILSDGSFELTDKIEPAAGHVYSFPIKEISRTGNTILMISEISEDTYLTIREIGLYIETPNGKLLFGSISNLTINKTRDLKYDLVFTVNTTVSVVNAMGFPTDDSFVINDPGYPEFKNFTTIKQVNAYVLTNLERIIRMNAGAKGTYQNSAIINSQAGIGDNRPQVIYRLQKEIEEGEDCYNSLDTYLQLINKFHKEIKKQVNYDLIDIHGNLEVPIDGKVDLRGVSSNDYITSNTKFSDTVSWRAQASFYTDSVIQNGPVFALGTSRTSYLTMGTKYDSSSRKNVCFTEIKNAPNFVIALGGSVYYYRDITNDKTYNDTDYYSWQISKNKAPYYNFHCGDVPYPIPLRSSAEVVMPYYQENYTTVKIPNFNPTSFSISLRVKFSQQFVEYAGISNILRTQNSNLSLILSSGKLAARLVDVSTGELISTRLKSERTLKYNKWYTISLLYNGEKYALKYETDDGDYEYEEFIEYSDKHISFGNTLVLGAIGTSGNFLPYTLDFSNFTISDPSTEWHGAVPIDMLYTNSETPHTSSRLYDKDFSLLTDTRPVSYSQGGTIVNSNLFTLENNTKYTVEISYSESSEVYGIYTVTMVKNDVSSSKQIVLSEQISISSNGEQRMGVPTMSYLGCNISGSHISNYPGIINLTDYFVEQGSSLWSFGNEIAIRNTDLIQYYRLPDYSKNQYTIRDMDNFERKLRFLDNEFEGNTDLINFLYPEGLTLCMKVDLQGEKSKVIMYKSNLIDNVYCSLTFIDHTLKFSFSTMNGTMEISKVLEVQEYSSYMQQPILITIIVTPQPGNYIYVQMFKNTEAITNQAYAQLDSTVDPSITALSNFYANTPDDEVGKFLQDLVVIKGVISEEDLSYLNDLFCID